MMSAQLTAETSSNKQLFEAILDSNLREVERLVLLQIDVNLPDESGHCPLHYLLSKTSHGEHDTEILKVLIQGGAKVNSRNKSGMTPLHCAAQGNLTDKIKVLLVNGADVFTVDSFNRSALTFAAKNWQHKCRQHTVLCNVEEEPESD